MGCFVDKRFIDPMKQKEKEKHFRKYILNVCCSDRSKGERLGIGWFLPFTRYCHSGEILFSFKEVIVVQVVLKEPSCIVPHIPKYTTK